MKHKWTKMPDQNMTFGNVKVWLCSVCRCKKTLVYGKYQEPDYERNGQLYTHYIECIDYEAEALKTID
ncbi:MAG: hypothetical protein JWQ66_2918 [Mucilaginibacter sp.]|nr:hypothetical protein [Mucilaginibacter sp.]